MLIGKGTSSKVQTKMNIKDKLPRIKQWLLRFVQLQLFLTIISLPIMLVWGLPISILSPIGNLIFGPVLTVFLFLCSLIFFCELLHIPNTLFIYALEKVTDWWLTIMIADPQTWLIGFVKPAWWFLISIPIIAFIIILHKKTAGLYTNIACLSILSVVIIVYLKSAALPKKPIIEIPCNNGALMMLTVGSEHVVIDPGFLGQRISAPSWAQYTLMPFIIKATGATTIDHLILMQPSIMLFQAIERLATKMNIKNIYLFCWQEQAPPSFMRNYFAMKRTIDKLGIKLIRIAHNHTIILDNLQTIAITKLPDLIKTADITYPALSISTQIDNKEFTLYSAKYAKKLKAHLAEKQQLATI